MKIWFDADNGPHVLVMRPLVAELTRRGHQVAFTARDRNQTCESLDLYGFAYHRVGGEYGEGMRGKIKGTLERAWQLARAMRGSGAAVSFGHGSRALPLASRLLGVPSVTMYDYEWVDSRLFNWGCRAILLPAAISRARCAEAGISVAKVISYPGYKEELYLGAGELDPTVADDLHLRPAAVKVLLRPPATTAHYHNTEAEGILEAVLARLASRGNLQLVYLPRTADQGELPALAGVSEVIIPRQVHDGPSLIAVMDLVVGGGGTMTREAALLGVPSYSFFRGRAGMVDDSLAAAGRLVLLTRPDEVAERLAVVARRGAVNRPHPAAMVEFISTAIIGAAGRRASASGRHLLSHRSADQ